MSATLFVYGTLLFPEVLSIVLDRSFTTHDYTSARLAGFRRMQFDDVFPVIRRDAASFVDGAIICDLSDEALRRLDFFESDLYVREVVEVFVNDISQKAYVYVDSRVGGEKDARVWNLESFRAHELPHYVANAMRWMANFR